MNARNAILTVVFLDMLGAGLVMPMIPFISQSFGAGPLLIGIFGSLFPLFQALASPIWGRLGDRYGRRNTLLLSIAGNLIAALLFVACAYVHSLWLLLFSRALAGAMSGSLVTARAYLSDLSKPSELAKSMGVFGAAQALGFACGPAIGGLATSDGFATPAWISATLLAISLVTSFFTLPSPKPTSTSETRQVSRDQKLFPYFLQLFFVTFSLSHLFVVFPLFIQERFNYGPRENGFYFGGLAVVAIFVQGFVFGKLSEYWRETKIFVVGLVLISTALFLFPTSGGPMATAIMLLVVAAGFSLCSPAIASIIQSNASIEEQGLVSGWSESFAATARTLGPTSAGLLIMLGGTSTAFAGAGLFGLLAIAKISISRKRILT